MKAVILTLLFCQLAIAGNPIEFPNLTQLERDAFSGVTQSDPLAHSFVAPNEKNPIRLRPILERLQEGGAYLVVGTERSFIAAALDPKIHYLIQVDRDTKVMMFNRINTILLAVAKDLKDYQKLRFEGRFTLMQLRVQQYLQSEEFQKTPFMDIETIKQATKDSNLIWWIKTVRESEGFREFGHAAEPRVEYRNFFRNARYTTDRELFARVQSLARAGRIFSLYGNLTNSQQMSALAQALQQDKISLSGIDVSNAWWAKYTGEMGMTNMLKALQPVLNEKSLLVVTNGKSSTGADSWEYMGLTVEEIEQRKTEPFYKNQILPNIIVNLFIAARKSCHKAAE